MLIDPFLEQALYLYSLGIQGIFPTQESNLGLPHCRQTLYCLSRPEGPRVSAAPSSPGRVSAPHGQALSGLLLPSKVTPLNRLWLGRLFVSDILVLFRLLKAPLAQLRRLGASITDSAPPREFPQTPPHRNLHEGPRG